MALLKDIETTNKIQLGLWQLDESLDDLEKRVFDLGFKIELQKTFASELKRRQWLACQTAFGRV